MLPLLRIFVFAWLATTLVACETEVEYDCSKDPDPVGLCKELHPKTTEKGHEWACLVPSCGNPKPRFDDGCTTVASLEAKAVTAEHACVTAWEQTGPEVHVGLLGLGQGRPVEVLGGELTPTVAEPSVIEFFAPAKLRLGQSFVARLSTNYRSPHVSEHAIVHLSGAADALIVGGDIKPAGQSQFGVWNVDITGSIAADGALVGSHTINISLLDAEGRIGPVWNWSVEIIGEPPLSCPLAANCEQRACGPDPMCGNECGTCAPDEACIVQGVCEPINPGACPAASDCTGRVCGVDPVCGIPCGRECDAGLMCDPAGQCVVDPDAGTTGDDMETDTETGCMPDCTGRNCGPDPVCGESCGECGEGIECLAGICEVCEPECDDRQCGLDPKCGMPCGTCDEGDECVGGQCRCKPECGLAECGLDPKCGTHDCGMCPDRMACNAGVCVDEPCEPDCSGRECGPDPKCGFTCGACDEGTTCVDGNCECEPSCTDTECGLDPVCGTEVCGGCKSWQACAQGTCECQPNCGAYECGTDPICGTIDCGQCDAGDICLAGLCQCEPECGDNECGMDPKCGTRLCGRCRADEDCNDGECECEPACRGNACGMDPVCGTMDCGSCEDGELCNNGQCVTECPNPCTGTESSCLDVDTVQTCVNDCLEFDDCREDFACQNGVCECQPACGGNNCGMDPVCGTLDCGTCRAGQECQMGTCVTVCENPCTGAGTECVDGATVRTCVDDCWEETACGDTFVCEAGQCRCPNGLMDCDGKCIDPQTDADYCGEGPSCDGLIQCDTDLMCILGKCLPSTCMGELTFDESWIEGEIRRQTSNPDGPITASNVGTFISFDNFLCRGNAASRAPQWGGVECLWALEVVEDQCLGSFDSFPPLPTLANLTRLRLNVGGTVDCTPLAEASSMKSLELNGGELTNPHIFSSMPNLETLHLHSSVDADLVDFRSAPRLRAFHVDDWKEGNCDGFLLPPGIEEIGFTGCATTSPVPDTTSFTNLSSLDISSNGLIDIPLDRFPGNIERLAANWNELETTPTLTSLDSLEFLALNGNEIEGIDATRLPRSIRELQVNGNPLGRGGALDFSHLTNLKILSAVWAGIGELTPLILPRTLQSLNLDQNALTSCPDVSADVGFESLETLVLSRNSIDVCNEAFLPPSLKHLDLHSNELTSCPDLNHLRQLETLSLSGNNIAVCSAVIAPPSLTELTFTYTDLAACPTLASGTSLEKIDLSANRIQSCEGLNFPASVKLINLVGNQISKVPNLSHATSLEHLDLQGSRISDLGGLTSLPDSLRYLVIAFDDDTCTNHGDLVREVESRIRSHGGVFYHNCN